MSFDFSFHRRRRNFPFPMFGFAATIGLTVFLLIFLIEGNNFFDLFTLSVNDEITDSVGYVLMITGFLSYMLGLGLIADIKADFKLILHFTHLAVFAFIFSTGYFIASEQLYIFIYGLFISLLANNTFLLIFFFYQKRTASSYSSRSMMAVTTISIFPAIYITYRVFTAGPLEFLGSSLLADMIAKILLVILAYISVFANSVYILYINRKVR
ncbi:MAG: hypothetical protein JXN10_11775 [Clostridia bacterium]|nr:hypothetical protein [Clostridia bacterium]MBN2884200.1 hypothetical protein [Clostridia bacterium]